MELTRFWLKSLTICAYYTYYIRQQILLQCSLHYFLLSSISSLVDAKITVTDHYTCDRWLKDDSNQRPCPNCPCRAQWRGNYWVSGRGRVRQTSDTDRLAHYNAALRQHHRFEPSLLLLLTPVSLLQPSNNCIIIVLVESGGWVLDSSGFTSIWLTYLYSLLCFLLFNVRPQSGQQPQLLKKQKLCENVMTFLSCKNFTTDFLPMNISMNCWPKFSKCRIKNGDMMNGMCYKVTHCSSIQLPDYFPSSQPEITCNSTGIDVSQPNYLSI